MHFSPQHPPALSFARLSLSCLLAWFVLIAGAQNKPTDSILGILKKPNTPDSVRAENILAYSYSWPNPRFDTMVPLLDEGYNRCLKGGLNVLARKLLARKIEYFASNDKGIEAFSICQEMIRLGEKDRNYSTIAMAYYFRGNIFQNFNMLDKAVEEEKKAISYLEKAGDPKALSEAQYLLAWYSFNNHDYNTSLSNFMYAYDYAVKYRKNEKGALGEYSGWIGNTYGALKKFDSAIYYRHLSLNYFREANDSYGYPDGFRYLGNIYRNMKRYDSAMFYYNKAHELFAEKGIRERKWLVEYFISEVFASLKDYRSSARELDLLLDTVKGSKDLLSLLFGTKLGGFVYEKNGEYKKAIRCYKDYMVYKDSSEKANQKGALTELDAKLKFEQEENLLKMQQAEKDAQAKQEADRQALIRNFLLGGFLLLGMFLIVVYRNFRQKQKANKLLEAQKNEIEYQKKEIQDSINYAQNIQSAVLPDYHLIEKDFTEMFILYKPKNVVSGDFFWFSKTNDKILIAAADCTGHGVPGAFMSMIGSYELNTSVVERGIVQPSKILSHINFSLKRRLRQNDAQTGNKDGMDIALCAFDLKNMQVQYAGANRPLYIIRNNEALEFAPTKAAIGGHTDDSREFDNNSIALEKGDCVYMYTDGYSDQFGGSRNKKLTTKNFKNLLRSIASKSMKEQYKLLENYFYEWKGNFEQLDDILVIGIRI